MKPETKKKILAALDRIERVLDGKVSITTRIHAKAKTYGERLEKWLDEAEKKP